MARSFREQMRSCHGVIGPGAQRVAVLIARYARTTNRQTTNRQSSDNG